MPHTMTNRLYSLLVKNEDVLEGGSISIQDPIDLIGHFLALPKTIALGEPTIDEFIHGARLFEPPRI